MVAWLALKDEEKALILHTSGLDRCRVSYRNYFACTPGTADHATCQRLVAWGLMELTANALDLFGGSEWFRLTRRGKAVARTLANLGPETE